MNESQDRIVSRLVLLNFTAIAAVLNFFMDVINQWPYPAFKWAIFVWAMGSVLSMLWWISFLVHHAWVHFTSNPAVRMFWVVAVIIGSAIFLAGPIAYYLYALEYLGRRASPQRHDKRAALTRR